MNLKASHSPLLSVINESHLHESLKAAVIIISDTVTSGASEDRSGKMLLKAISPYFIGGASLSCVPDEIEQIQGAVKSACQAQANLILCTGGTGIGKRDVTPEAISPLLTLPIPGIMEAFRNYSQQRNPYAMLSRGVAGLIEETMIVTLPGSPSAAEDGIAVLFPTLLHFLSVRSGQRHSPVMKSAPHL